MCRYAFKLYKPHYVCFACRKQFKRPPLEDVLAAQGKLASLRLLRNAHYLPAERARAERRTGTTLNALSAEYHALVSKCPQCAGLMADLALDFKPPPTSAVRAWARIQATYRLGHRWLTCGCDGPGFVPSTGPEFIRYLNDRRSLFAARISQIQRDDSLSSEQRIADLAHWSDLLQQVERERDEAKCGVQIRRPSRPLQRTVARPRSTRSRANRGPSVR